MGREPTAVHLPCARSHANASKLDVTFVDQCFYTVFVGVKGRESEEKRREAKRSEEKRREERKKEK